MYFWPCLLQGWVFFFFFPVLLSVFLLSSIFNHLLSRVQHIFWNQTIVDEDFELELFLHCTKKSLWAGAGEPCPNKDRTTWIERLVGLCTRFPSFFFWLNCVAQNSIAEDGSRVSSTELELKFGENPNPHWDCYCKQGWSIVFFLLSIFTHSTVKWFVFLFFFNFVVLFFWRTRVKRVIWKNCIYSQIQSYYLY